MSTHNLCFEQNKKNNVYPYKPQFYYIKVGFKGVNIIHHNLFITLLLGVHSINSVS